MGKRFIDLSITIEDGLPSDPPAMVPKILYLEHEAGAASMAEFFPGIDTARDLPEGLGWAVEILTLATHSGTHLDAPWHYHPTMDKGRPAFTIEEVPLEWCMGPGIVLDFRHFPDGYRVMAADMEEAFEKIGYELKEGDIVLVMTGADRYWGKPEYLVKGCGMGKEATLWLLDRGVKVTGTDAWSGPAPAADRQGLRGDRGLLAYMGGTFRLHRERVLPHRKVDQPGPVAGPRFHLLLLSRKDQKSQRGMDKGRGPDRGLSGQERDPHCARIKTFGATGW